MDYLSSLNEKQREAVFDTEGYLRVIAGAGSGKTKLLVSRYAYLVKNYGIDSANILCVTFTNKAAGEMKRRIRALIGEEYDTSLICTYHGFCARVLREDVEKIFYPKEFQIIDNSQQKDILADIYKKFDLKLDHASFEKIVKQIAIFKSKRSYVSKMCSRDAVQILPDISTLDDRIIEEFLQRQKQIYAMDFNDLMFFTLDMFARCPEILKKWQDRLNYIQVDEFQDSSSTEMELADLLSAKHKNLMIVGDPDQNIYEWRGSDVKLLVDFDKTHFPTRTVILNRNYRSTPQILNCANALIEKNVFRLKKELYTKSGLGSDVYHYHMKNEYAEAEKIIDRIHEIRRETGCNYADFAVLYRSGFLSRVIEKKFTENGVPYEIFGGVKFYLRMEIQDIMAYLRLAAFDDDISLKRIINKPRRRFGRTKLQHLLAIRQDGVSLYETLKSNIDDPVFKNSGTASFCDLIEGIRAAAETQPLSETFEKLCAESGYEKYIRELGDLERFENLSEFKRIVAEYEKNFGEEVPLKEFINHIALQSEDDGEESCDMVKLMTIHAAKGLEFPNVFVVGLSEGIFPSSKTVEERKQLGLEEERRLCYVAITRAEKRLMLLDSEGYSQNGKQKLPSRFLKEIGEENYIRIGTISKELQQSADKYASSLSGEPAAGVSRQIGDRVTHPAFGEGTVTGRGIKGNSLRIKFDSLASERDISADFFNRSHEAIVILPTAGPEEKPEKEAEICAVQENEATVNVTPGHDDKAESGVSDGYDPISERTLCEEVEIDEKQPERQKERPDTEDYENLWKRDDVPKSGWSCVDVIDLGEPTGICEMCGHQIIRYVHYMVHPLYRPIKAGCVCAGKMEGSIDQARLREQEFKSRQARKANFKSRKWKISKNNNRYIKLKDHLIVLYYSRNNNNWKYSIDNVFCPEVFPTEDDAADAAFEAFDNKIRQPNPNTKHLK